MGVFAPSKAEPRRMSLPNRLQLFRNAVDRRPTCHACFAKPLHTASLPPRHETHLPVAVPQVPKE